MHARACACIPGHTGHRGRLRHVPKFGPYDNRLCVERAHTEAEHPGYAPTIARAPYQARMYPARF